MFRANIALFCGVLGAGDTTVVRAPNKRESIPLYFEEYTPSPPLFQPLFISSERQLVLPCFNVLLLRAMINGLTLNIFQEYILFMNLGDIPLKHLRKKVANI